LVLRNLLDELYDIVMIARKEFSWSSSRLYNLKPSLDRKVANVGFEELEESEREQGRLADDP